jgi:hypothetical protein
LDTSLRLLRITAQNVSRFGERVVARTRFDSDVRDKVLRPFQLVEFQNERQLLLEELDRCARTNRATISLAVKWGYPEYSADLAQPGLLWAELAMVHSTCLTALHCGVRSIDSVSVRQPRPIQLDESQPPVVEELPGRILVTGSMGAVRRFLTCLALRTEEGKALGLPPIAPGKPALFIDRIMLKRDMPVEPDTVRLEMRYSGLFYRE